MTIITLFSTGWMVTGSLAETIQRSAVHDALKDRLASICVAQFEQSAIHATAIDALKDTQEWQRGDYVQETGRATMPGSDGSEGFVADECAERIIAQAG